MQSVTGAADGAPGSVYASSSALLTSPAVPPPVLGSPWVTSELSTVLVDILGGENLPITREQAMQVPAVAKARHTICPTLGRIPLIVQGTDNDETLTFVRQPDRSMSRFLLLTWTFDDQLFHGVSWWQVLDRYASRRVRNVRRILPGGVARGEHGSWAVYGEPVDPANLVRLDGPHEGILNFASTTIRQASDLESSAAKTAKNPIPAIDLHQTSGPTLSKTERTELVSEWAAARAGANGAVAYTSPNVEARALGQAAEQLLISGRNAAAVDVARHAGLPADAVDATPEKTSLTYNTAETKMRALIDFGLAAYGEALVSRLSLSDITPAGSTVAFDYDAITATTDADPSTPAPAAGAPSSQPGSAPTERPQQ